METHQSQPMQPSVAVGRQTRALYALVALLVAAVGVLLVVWLLGRGGGDGTASLPAIGAGPAAVSAAQLEELAKKTDHPVYWAGSRDGAYELTRTTGGRIYVRYLPDADSVGDASAKYLTVGTYPQKNAFRSIQRAARRPGVVSLKLPHGGVLVFSEQTPKSVYFGYPGSSYQVEVFDPSPAVARTLVLNGTIKPLE